MSLNMALQAGISGLMTSQKAVDTTANNIANVNTIGYTKKTHVQESVIIAGRGQGVQDLVNVRTVDESLQRDLFTQSGVNNTLSVLNDYANRIQDLFGEPSDNNSLSHTVSTLQTSMETLSTDPSSYTAQADYVNQLTNTFNQINNMADYIQNLRLEADRQVSQSVTEINNILEQIDKLNDDVMRTDVVGQFSSDDLKDQRDLLLSQLSELMDVNYYTRDTGEMVITTTSGEMLLDEYPNKLSFTGSTHLSAWTTKDGGEIPGIMLNGTDITSDIKSGQMKGFIEMRDEVIPDLQAQLDELTAQMTETLNQVNNQGISFSSPASEMTGTKNFIDPASQSINISNGEVRIVIFDKAGNEIAGTALVSELGFSEGAIYDSATHPTSTNATLAATIQNWLTTDPTGPQLSQAKVGVDVEGNFFVDLGTSEYSIGFRDEASSVLGSDQKDVTVQFDADGDGKYDQQSSGFSNFLGLNDLVMGRSDEWLYDSEVVSGSFKTSNTALSEINISYEGNMNAYQIQITPGMSLDDIADKINNDPIMSQDIKAEVVAEGGGYRLRIQQIDGKQMEITELTDTNVLSSLGMGVSSCGLANIAKINPVITETPSKVSVGSVQFNTASGNYYISESDNTVIQKMAEVFAANEVFTQAGSMAAGDYNFADYSASIVSQVSLFYNNNNAQFTYQNDLVAALQTKNSEVSGVNLDEELALLIIYERSYSASSQVITTVNEMLQVLEDMV